MLATDVRVRRGLHQVGYSQCIIQTLYNEHVIGVLQPGNLALNFDFSIKSLVSATAVSAVTSPTVKCRLISSSCRVLELY